MTRVQKRFLQKIAKPILVISILIGTITAMHFAATFFWGYTLVYILSYVILALFYIIPAIFLLSAVLYLPFKYCIDKWYDAKEEVEQETETFMEILKK